MGGRIDGGKQVGRRRRDKRREEVGKLHPGAAPVPATEPFEECLWMEDISLALSLYPSIFVCITLLLKYIVLGPAQ